MSQDYLFKEIRKGVTAARQIVATGYCTAEFLEDREVCAILVRNGQEKELACECKLAQAPAFNRQHNKEKIFSRILTISVCIPCKVDAKDSFLLHAKNADGTAIRLCQCKGAKIIKEMQDINYAVDAVKEEGGAFVIRGWAIDYEDITITLQDRKNGEPVPLPENVPEWYMRSDAMRRFTECEQTRKIGFSMKLPLDWSKKSLVMKIKAGKYEKKENIQKDGSHFVGKHMQTL